MRNHLSEYEGLISLYALGVLDGDDLIKVEDHLITGCEACKEMLKETELVLSLIPFTLNGQLSPGVRKKLWNKILYS